MEILDILFSHGAVLDHDINYLSILYNHVEREEIFNVECREKIEAFIQALGT